MSAHQLLEAYLRAASDLKQERGASRRRLRLLREVVASVEACGELDPRLDAAVREELDAARSGQLRLFREGAEDTLPPAA